MKTFKAADIGRSQLGLMVRVAQGAAQFTDLLRGVSHEADLIEERKISDEVPSYVLGRISTTLTFALAGPVRVDGNTEVEVSMSA